MAGTPAGPLRRGAALEGLTVADVLLRRPKTMPADATVAQARQSFRDDHVHMLLLVTAGRLTGTLQREDLPDAAPEAGAAQRFAELDQRTFEASLPAEQARQLLLAQGQRRRAVIDEQGRLVGLLCLKRRQTGFCSDNDVSARAADRPCTPENGQSG